MRFDYWKFWSDDFGKFRRCFGVYAMIQFINLVLLLSDLIPSIGILQDTIKASLGDVSIFSCIFILFYFIQTMVNHLLYGDHLLEFSTLVDSANENYLWIYGKF